MRGWWALAFALPLLGGLLSPTAASAQAGFYVTPSFGIAELYDDNIFYTPSPRQSDFITRFSPGIQAGYQSTPLTLLGRYTFDAEVYADRSELNDAQVRQEASLDFRYLPDPTLTLSTKAAFLKTQTPQELNVTTGVAAGRARARRYTANPAVTYRYDPLTSGTAEYRITRDEILGGVSTDTHDLTLDLDRRITPLDTALLGYHFTGFVFDNDSSTSHAVTVGWRREFTPLLSVTLRGGPRFNDDGEVAPEVSGTIRYRLRRGELSLTYTRSQTTAIGIGRSVDTESVSGTATYDVLPELTLRARPSFVRGVSSTENVATVYRAELDATYRFTTWLSLIASYQFTHQGGLLTGGTEKIIHNVVLLQLVVSYPYRVY
jgi:hypothetical protein